MNLTLQAWQLVLGFLGVVGAAWLTARYTSRASVKVAEVSVEEGAFLRAEGIYKNAITRLEKELEDERKARQELAREFHEAKIRWENERGQLQMRIEQLEQA